MNFQSPSCKDLKGLFEDHYVTLPDEKYDIFESMVAKLDDMEDKLNEQIETNVNLSQQMSGIHKSVHSWLMCLGIFQKLVRTRLAGLAESVEFESEESYRSEAQHSEGIFIGTPIGEPLRNLTEVP